MKTKHLLTALALPAVFAACTNEEIVQENQIVNSALENRPVVDLSINAYKHGGETAESRIVGGDYNGGIRWYWEDENDKIGAVVVDFTDPTGGTIVDESWGNYVITNYPFAPQISEMAAKANFQTPTAVVEGAYIFYNRYEGDMVKRGKISHSIPRILTAKEGHEDGLTQVGTPENGGQNFFISPIYNIAVADGDEVETNVGMKAIHSILKFTLKTDLKKSDSDPDYYYDKGFKVSKIELKALGNQKFNRTFVLNPAELSKVQLKALNAYRDAAKNDTYEYNRRQSLYNEKTGKIRSTEISNEYVEEATNVVADYITNPKNSTLGDWDDVEEVLTYELDEPYVFEGKDQTMELMVVVPSAEYKQVSNLEDKYEDKNQGVFLMKVYTSEGIYNSYLLTGDLDADDKPNDWILTDNAYTLARGVQYTMPTKTMKIDGGKTNITLFEQNEAFNVETTSDWNYTIEYIQEHYRDYGNSNSWKTPQINLINPETVITVDADHFFPNFPVKYTGAKTLSLVGQEDYVFDPVTAIFATDEARPTLKVVGQPEATISFKGDVKKGIDNYKGEENSVDGVDATHAVKLISDAQVVIAEAQTVNFEHLESATALTLNEGAAVNVTDETHAVLTGGAVDVLSGAVLNIANDWANAAVVNVETEALVVVADGAINNGTVNVWGDLNVNDFKNGYDPIDYIADKKFLSAEGNLVVKGYAEGMNNNERGIAQFINLTNKWNSEITTEVSSSSKANYGGWIIVGELNTDKTSVNSTSGKLVNNGGNINVYGELMAAEVESSGMITLGGDPYALLILLDGNVTTGKTTGYNGSVVLEDASEYPMFDNYYAKWNDISEVLGTIETTLDNATYQKVFANMINEDYKGKEKAWEVLNKVTLTDEVLVMEGTYNGYKVENDEIEFVLADDAKLNAYKNDITVGAITVEGVDAAIKATPASGNASQTIKINDNGILTVTKNASATVEAKANVIFAKQADEMIEIAGSLTNQGYMDVVSAGQNTLINTNIAATGEFINEGRLSMPSDTEVTANANTATVEEFVNWFGSDLLLADDAVAGVYYNFYQNDLDEWTPATEMNAKLFKAILAGTTKTVGNYTVKYFKVEFSEKANYGVKNHGYYYIWVKNQNVLDVAVQEAKSTTELSDGRTMFDQVVDKVTEDTPYSVVYPTWFNVVNEGLLDLLYSADEANWKHSWAYGQSQNGSKATKSGKFNNELTTQIH